MDNKTMREIEQIIGYEFSDPKLLQKAFTHASSVDTRTSSNERFEFLGDSVLALVICQTLFEKFPDYLEGDLTKLKSMLVSRRVCAKVARQLDLQKHLKLGKGMLHNRALAGSIAAGLLEAIIAAIYIDGGFKAVQDFILRIFNEPIKEASAEQSHGNYKSLLQQHAQQNLNFTPHYHLLDEKGPDHDKCFESEAIVGQQSFPSAWGVSKKEAEQKAAYNALVELGIIEEISET